MQVVARERTHGPYRNLESAEHALTVLEGIRAHRPNPEEISGMFAVEKGTITWQEN